MCVAWFTEAKLQQHTLEGKAVVITGATGGLGTAVTAAFLEAGADVAAVDRKADGGETDHYIAIAADLTTLEGAQAAARGAIEQWGRIDVLVQLVGGYAGGKSVADSDDDAFDQMMNINLRTAFHMFRAVLPLMRAQGGGRILAIGSRAAVEPSPLSGLYAASKAALVSLVRAIAAENADHKITANLILPGTMDTPGNRAAMPKADFTQWVPTQQVASMLVQLAGDDASAVNGAVIPIFGTGA